MNEEAIRPGWSRHRGKPVITYSKFLRQRSEHRELLKGITFHNLAWVVRINVAIPSDEALVVDLRVIASFSAELLPHIFELMTWIMEHGPESRSTGNYCIAMRTCVPVIIRAQSLDGCRLAAEGID